MASGRTTTCSNSEYLFGRLGTYIFLVSDQKVWPRLVNLLGRVVRGRPFVVSGSRGLVLGLEEQACQCV